MTERIPVVPPNRSILPGQSWPDTSGHRKFAPNRRKRCGGGSERDEPHLHPQRLQCPSTHALTISKWGVKWMRPLESSGLGFEPVAGFRHGTCSRL